MDFLDPVKKRHHRIRLFVGYLLIAIAIMLGSFILLLQTYGYDIDRRTGQVIQKGLVYVSSHPVSADVYVNDELKGSTNLKLTLPSGSYSFVIKSHGYRDWTSKVNLAGGDVEQLTYPLLVPQKLNQKEIQPYSKAPAISTQSPDKRWLLVILPDTIDSFDVFDTNNLALAPTRLKLPAGLLQTATGNQSLKAVEWSSDNKHILFEHDYNGGKEFINVDRTNAANSINVNKVMNISPDKMVLRNKQPDQMYAYFAKTKSLISINTTTKQSSTTLQNVIDFKANGTNTILYTSDKTNLAGQYAVNIWDGQKSYLLHDYPATNYLLDMADYSGQTYVAVAPVSTNKVYIYKDPLQFMQNNKVPNPFIALKINNPQVLSFSANTRFIGTQSSSSFAVYDFEKALWHYFTLKEKVPLEGKAQWMDGHRFILNIAGKVNVFDFNGGNQQDLVSSNDGSNGYFNRNYANFLTLAPSVKTAGGQALTNTSMIVGK